MVDSCLDNCVVEIQRFGEPLKDKRKNKEDSNGRPCYDSCIRVKVNVLQVSSQDPSCFPIGDTALGSRFRLNTQVPGITLTVAVESGTSSQVSFSSSCLISLSGASNHLATFSFGSAIASSQVSVLGSAMEALLKSTSGGTLSLWRYMLGVCSGLYPRKAPGI
jgi:hypothetical protein